jgi:DNA-binding response OmpR family regulator
MKEVEILLIDTDKVLMADTVSTLEAAGFQVTCVARGHQVLDGVYEGSPDLVIMAEEVPGLNVEELCCKLRQISHLPIIVLGNTQEEGHENDILEAGADAYMSKPPGAAELVARVHSLLRRTKGLEYQLAEEDPRDDLRRRTAKRGNGGGRHP